MDSESFWICICGIIASCFLGLVISITTYEIRTAAILAQALKDNPQRPALDITCGLNFGNMDICAIRAAAK